MLLNLSSRPRLGRTQFGFSLQMANSISVTSFCSFSSTKKSVMVLGDSVAGKVLWANKALQRSEVPKFRSLVVKAANGNQSTKPNSLICADCDGNGAKQCGQCKGTGVNSVDHFNGQFKAGAVCWLCRGKKEILCGNCNGAGFIGGFMSTFDD